MAGIDRLGYLVFEVSDLAAWESFAVDMLGMIVGRKGADGSISLRMDGQAHRIFLLPGDADDLLYAGFELETDADLEALAQRLAGDGVTVRAADAETADHRQVERLLQLEDPNGLGIELFCRPAMATEAFESSHVPSGFVTGEEGLGHIVLNVKDAQASERFYMDLLGMKLSDRVDAEVAPGFSLSIAFLHANSRHHSLAFSEVDMPKKMHHFMIEAQAMDAVGLAYDRCLDSDVRISSSLGRHPNDLMFSFYAQTPSGFDVEFGWGGRKVDDATWQIGQYDRVSIWGHRRETGSRSEA